MLVTDLVLIGNRLLAVRKRLGLTQAEVAERARLSDRTYADIERGTVNMRIETVLQICEALYITPDQIFTAETEKASVKQSELMERLEMCTSVEKETALALLEVYLNSLAK